MVFATKILYKIFDISELLGHNVSGKTFNKYIKNKKALDEKRINYIKWLVENHFETNNKEELWKACRTAINKSIRNNELKGIHALTKVNTATTNHNEPIESKQPNTSNEINIAENSTNANVTLISLEPNMSIFQMTNEIPLNLDEANNKINKTVVKLIDTPDIASEAAQEDVKTYLDFSKSELSSKFNIIVL